MCEEPSLCQSVTKKRERERGASQVLADVCIIKKLLCKRLTYASGYAMFASFAQEPDFVLSSCISSLTFVSIVWR